MPNEILRFPPVLQLALLALLAAYVLLSLLARASPRFRWLWRDRAESGGGAHVFVYTVVPALMLLVAGAAVYLNWNASAPLSGGWTARELALGPGAALLGLVVVIAGQLLGRGADLDDASRPAAWIPLVTILVGVALLAVGVTTMGRTVKRTAPATTAPPA